MSIMPWFFEPLLPRSFRLVLIDPPWEFQTYSRAGQGKSAQAHYTVMPLDAIKVLPVRDLCQDDAIVMCWATIPMLPHALACLEAWRVTYKSNIVWRKVTRRGKLRMGCGFWTRSMHEQVLIGTIGKPPLITFPSIFDGIARQHSRKPDELYQMIADRTPGWRRADIFSRETRHGWHAWGSEAGKYDDEVRDAPIRQAGIKQRQAQKEATGESDAPKPDVELVKAVEPVQDSIIYIEKINAPFLYQLKGTPAEYKAGLDFAIAKGWLWLHESRTYVRFAEAGAGAVRPKGLARNKSMFRCQPPSLKSRA